VEALAAARSAVEATTASERADPSEATVGSAPERPPAAGLKVVVLVNASAGAAALQGADRLGEALAEAFETSGLSVEIELVGGEDMRAAAEAARDRAHRAEIGAVAVGGGDGTISTVAGVLAGTGIPLGILPLGTLNHFAKDLGLPADVDEAVVIIARGETRTVDVAEVNGRVFVNNSSIGLYPLMVLDRERRRASHGYRKWSATALAAVRVLRHFSLRRLTLRAEGISEPCRTPLLFIGNNRYEIAGRSLGGRGSLEDGELCVYVAKQHSRLALIWLGVRSLLGWLDEDRDLRILNLRSAEIATRRRRLLVALDGEIALLTVPLRYRIRPGALKVFAPRAARDERV
jgi:diacylglycerol kinase family enzyme